MSDTSVSPSMPLVPYQGATLVLELRGSESEKMSPYVGSLRGTVWGSSNFFHQINPHWFLQPEILGIYLPGTGTLGWGPGVGLGLLIPRISLLNFYPPHMGMGPAHSISLPLLQVWMDVVSLILSLSDFHSTQLLSVLSSGCSIFSL